MKAETHREQTRVLVKRVLLVFSLQLSLAPNPTVTFFHNHDTKSATKSSRCREPDKPCKKTGFTFRKEVGKSLVAAGCVRKWNERKNDITYLKS